MSKVVHVVQVEITETNLQDIIDILNKREIDDGEVPLTLQEVVKNKQLLEYICKEAVNDILGLYDPHELWNNGGWEDFKEFRTV